MGYLLKRVLGLVPTALGVVILVSLMIHVVPGDPVDHLLGDYASLEQKTELRQKLGLDKPIFFQILQYLWGVAHGHLGDSLLLHQPVGTLIGERIGPTLQLACLAMLAALCISLPLGIISYWRKHTYIDHVSMTFALLGIAIPNFWLGPLLVMIFALNLNLLPVSERTTWDSYILPMWTLGIALAALLSRMTRHLLLEISAEDYVRTARAKGLNPVQVICKHMLRNAAIPLVTILGLQFGVLLTGAVVTERIFDWPGLGSLMIDALQNRDYPLIQGCVLWFAMTYVFVNLATDLLYSFLDPRVESYA